MEWLSQVRGQAACRPRAILVGSVPVQLLGPPAPQLLAGFAPDDLTGAVRPG